VLGKICIWYVSEILAKSCGYFAFRCRVERVIEICERVRGRDQDQLIELVLSVGLAEHPRDIFDERLLSRLVKVSARFHGVVGSVRTLMPSPRSLGAELMGVTVNIRVNEFALRVERVLRLPLQQNAGASAVGYYVPDPGGGHSSSFADGALGKTRKKSQRADSRAVPYTLRLITRGLGWLPFLRKRFLVIRPMCQSRRPKRLTFSRRKFLATDCLARNCPNAPAGLLIFCHFKYLTLTFA
jgi:hypothetical protein